MPMNQLPTVYIAIDNKASVITDLGYYDDYIIDNLEEFGYDAC